MRTGWVRDSFHSIHIIICLYESSHNRISPASLRLIMVCMWRGRGGKARQGWRFVSFLRGCRGVGWMPLSFSIVLAVCLMQPCSGSILLCFHFLEGRCLLIRCRCRGRRPSWRGRRCRGRGRCSLSLGSADEGMDVRYFGSVERERERERKVLFLTNLIYHIRNQAFHLIVILPRRQSRTTIHIHGIHLASKRPPRLTQPNSRCEIPYMNPRIPFPILVQIARQIDLPEQIPQTDIPPALQREVDAALDELGFALRKRGVEG